MTTGKKINERLERHNITRSGFKAVSFGVSFIILMGILYSNVVVPALNRHLPIITEEYAVFVNESNYQFIARVFMKKGVECIFHPGSERGYALIDGSWEEVGFQFLDDISPGSSKGVDDDFQGFGIWEWSTKHIGDATEVRATVKHICNADVVVTKLPNGTYTETVSGDVRITSIGPFNMEQIREEHRQKIQDGEKQNVQPLNNK